MFKQANLPANLFIDTPEINDASLHKLSNDVDSWPEEIIQKLKERVPKVSGMNTMVKFMKKDEENGTATGAVVITSPEKTAIVPIIIKSFMLNPLDIMIAKQKLLPLNVDYFESVFDDNNVFQKLEEYPTFSGLGRFDQANMWDAIYPPSMGRYAYASAGYPILESMTDSLSNIGELKKSMVEDLEATARFHKSAHYPLIKKLAHYQPVNMKEFAPSETKLIPKSVVEIIKEGPNKYNVLSCSDNTFHPGFACMNREDTRKFMTTISDNVEDTLHEVDQNGEKLVKMPEGNDGVFLFKKEMDNPELAAEFDHYLVKTKDGVGVKGVVIPKVIDFDQEPRDVKIFIGKTLSAVQGEICGQKVTHSGIRLEGEAPQMGQTGVFVYQPDPAHALSTIPVTMKTVVQECGSMVLKAYDLFGLPIKIKICPSNNVERIAKVPCPSGDYYVLPRKMKWIPLPHLAEVTDSRASYLVKNAAQRLTVNPVTIIPTGGDQFSLKGVEKYASFMEWDSSLLSRGQVNFLLSCMGCPQEKLAEAYSYAGVHGKAELHGLNRPPLKHEKLAGKKEVVRKAAELCKKAKANLYKEASYMDSSQTVDALLSLNFITPETITKYIGNLPSLKAAISTLANCLLASRLGIKEIPEAASSTAMQRLIEVVTGLERLRATQELNTD